MIIGKINVDEQPDIAKQYNVSALPTLVYLNDGETITSEVGGRSKSDIQKNIQDRFGL